jgi:hypothetical protein
MNATMARMTVTPQQVVFNPENTPESHAVTAAYNPDEERNAKGEWGGGDGESPEFHTVDAAFGDEFYAQHPLDKVQAESVRSYTTNSYQRINRYLRTGNPTKGGVPSDKTVTQVQEAIRNIDSSMRPLPEDIILRRGVQLDCFGADETTDMTRLIGKTFEEKGYLSTTIKDVGFKRRVQLEVLTPRGTPAVWVDPVSSYTSQGLAENEMLLGRGLRYVVQSAEDLHPAESFDAKWKVVVKIVP